MTEGQCAHAMAMALEVHLRAELREAVKRLRDAGAQHTFITDYLRRCAAAGRVLPLNGVTDATNVACTY